MMHLTETENAGHVINPLNIATHGRQDLLFPSPYLLPNLFTDDRSAVPVNYLANELKFKSKILHFSNLKYPPDFSLDSRSNFEVWHSNETTRKTKTNYNIENILNSRTDSQHCTDKHSTFKDTNSKIFKPYLEENDTMTPCDSSSTKHSEVPLEKNSSYKLPTDLLMDERNGIDGLLSLAKVANEQLGEEIAKEKRKNKSNNSLHLWEFLLNLLETEERKSSGERCIEWTNKEAGEFRLTKTSVIATLWGKSKNRTNMTYEKMARAMRYYYKMKVLVKVPHKRLHFQFGPRMNLKLENRSYSAMGKPFRKVVPNKLNIDPCYTISNYNVPLNNDNETFLNDLNTPIDDLKSPFNELKSSYESKKSSFNNDMLNPYKTSIFFPQSPIPTRVPVTSSNKQFNPVEMRNASLYQAKKHIYPHPSNATSVIISNGSGDCYGNSNMTNYQT